MTLRKARQAARDAYLTMCDTAYMSLSRKPPVVSGGILLTHLYGIGDFFLWLQAARAFREQNCAARITLLAEAAYSEYASRLGFFDEVISVERGRLLKSLAYRYDVYDRVRSRRYDMAVLPNYNRLVRFADGESVIRIARADRKVGSVGDQTSSWRDRVSRTWYSDLVPARAGLLHEIDRNAELMQGMGIEHTPASRPDPPTRAALTHLISEPYYVLIPGAGSPTREWPAAHFARLAERLSREMGWTGVLCGGPKDKKVAAEVQGLCGVNLRNYVGQTSLEGLVEIVRGAKLLVGNETGAVHIAASVTTPSVSITGGGHFNRFVPYPAEVAGPVAASFEMPCFNCNWHCIYPHRPGEPAPCVAGVSIDTVWSKIEEVLRAADSRYDQRYVTYH